MGQQLQAPSAMRPEGLASLGPAPRSTTRLLSSDGAPFPSCLPVKQGPLFLHADRAEAAGTAAGGRLALQALPGRQRERQRAALHTQLCARCHSSSLPAASEALSAQFPNSLHSAWVESGGSQVSGPHGAAAVPS